MKQWLEPAIGGLIALLLLSMSFQLAALTREHKALNVQFEKFFSEQSRSRER